MRKQLHISEELLRACLHTLCHVTLEFLFLVHDYDTGVYHVVNMQGRVYLWIRTFETQQLQKQCNASNSQRALRASWKANLLTIRMAVILLEKLAEVLRSRILPYLICHADPHTRNLIRDQEDQMFVIDWDEVMLTRKERDFIFLKKLSAEAFFQGYASVERDWSLLTYSLWERVVQDLMYLADNVCFRGDWTEEMRDQLVQTFHEFLEPGGNNLHAASEASANGASLSSSFPLHRPFLSPGGGN